MKSIFQSARSKSMLSLLFTFSLVMGFRSSAVEAYKIPSGSMMPTLLVGDQIFVNKLAYGLRVPFTDLKFLSSESHYLFKTTGPVHGDIIVFRHPVKTDIFLIKRVIGLSGDTIEMRNKVVFVNGKSPARDELNSEERAEVFRQQLNHDFNFPTATTALYSEKFDHTHGINMVNSQIHYSENFGPVTVPAGEYFCMGDNRDNSDDSRFWGFVPFGNIQGKAMMTWLSMELPNNEHDFVFRPERIGKILN